MYDKWDRHFSYDRKHKHPDRYKDLTDEQLSAMQTWVESYVVFGGNARKNIYNMTAAFKRQTGNYCFSGQMWGLLLALGYELEPDSRGIPSLCCYLRKTPKP